MTSHVREFVSKDGYVAYLRQDNNEFAKIDAEHESVVREKDAIIKEKDAIIKRQRKTIALFTEVDVSDDEDDEIGSGIIYFVEDKDVPDRGKIGRTKNTDIRKLKARYTTFASPNILCYYSADIKTDENELKKLMRSAGCMKSNTEKLSNCDIASKIFYDFARGL
jgi:hypothetical protein